MDLHFGRMTLVIQTKNDHVNSKKNDLSNSNEELFYLKLISGSPK